MNHLAFLLIQVGKELIRSWEFTIACQAFGNQFWSWKAWKGSLKHFLTLAGGLTELWIKIQRRAVYFQRSSIWERSPLLSLLGRICLVITLSGNTLLSPWHQPRMGQVLSSAALRRFFLGFGDRRVLGEVTKERKLGAAYASHCRSFS